MKLGVHAVLASVALATGTLLAATQPSNPSLPGPYVIRTAFLTATLPNGTVIPFSMRLPAAPATARPVVLVIHGYATVGVDYSWIADHLATCGFAAALVETVNPLDPDLADWVAQAIATLDALASANTNPWSGVMGELDLGHVAALGHSYGAATAIVSAASDPRIKAVVAIEPGAIDQYHADMLASAGKVTVPILYVGGQLDQICPPATQVLPAFQATHSSNQLYVEIARADHMGMLDFEVSGSSAYLPFEQEHEIASRYFTAWLETFVMGQPDTAGYTNGVMATSDLTAGVLSKWLP